MLQGIFFNIFIKSKILLHVGLSNYHHCKQPTISIFDDTILLPYHMGMMNIHWLPVKKRITYKIALFVYMSINNLTPHYISSLISLVQQSSYSLRSRTDPLRLQIPKMNSKKGQQCISFTGPSIWNSLPINIRSCRSVKLFKNKLKTYLFSL